MQLSKQAIACVMICLQKGLMEQTDIVPMLEELQLMESEQGLLVLNPPNKIDGTKLQELAEELEA